jgi:glycosyltransferase involved in cell wall biosynthesis
MLRMGLLPGAAVNPRPRVSIVTPSFQQGRYLEATLRSVHDQAYPDVEHLVVDGASTDGTIELLRRWSDRLAWWVSEPDGGQSDAINKGFARSTGQILGWLNSDDQLAPGALERIADALSGPDGADVVVGDCIFAFEATGTTRTLRGEFEGRDRLLRFWRGYRMHQPAIWWRREVYDRIGGLDPDHDLIMDFDYWVRMVDAGFRFTNVDAPLAIALHHSDAKTADGYRGYYRSLRAYVPRAMGLSPTSPRWWAVQAVMHAHRCINAMRRPLRPVELR